MNGCDDTVHVQPLLRAACEAMAVGELVHTEAFSLFEAMSAVEVGNPKMDMAAGPRTSPLPLEERPLQLDLSPEQLLSVMDHLLCLEAAWHCGSSLAQTIYSSLYMMQIPRLAGQAALSAYCQAVQALCQQVNAIVMAGCVCEEEDFNPSMVGLPLTDGRPDKCLGALSMAADRVQSQEPSPAPNGRCGMANGKESNLGDQSALLSKAVVSRLRLRRYLHQALAKLQLKGRSDLDEASVLLLKAQSELEAVRASAHLASGDVLGFDELLNAHVTPAAPPRNVQAKSIQEALDYFETLMGQLVRVCTITAVTDYDGLKAFLESFAASCPCAVARSALHMQLAPKSWEGEVAPAWAPSEAMLVAALHIDEGVLQGGDLEGGADVHLFLEQALIAVGNWCQAMLMNRCRQRRRLRRGLDDWANLYQHALNADCTLFFQRYLQQNGWQWVPEAPDDPQGPLASWVEKETALHMLNHLMLGFELQLYEPAEFTMLYWYCDYLYSIAIHDVKAIQTARPKQLAVTSNTPKHGKKGRSHAAKEQQQQFQQAPVHVFESVVMDCSRQLCQGTLRLVLGLSMIGALKGPTLPFNSGLQRFEQRFACFHMLPRPDALQYDQFSELTSTSGCQPEKLLQLAADAFAKVRQGCTLIKANPQMWGANDEQTQQVGMLERVAMQNLVAITLLLRMLPGNTLPTPSLQFSQHCRFPVMVLRTQQHTSSK